MRSAYVRRSGHGLDSAAEVDWRERAACRGKDPDWWELVGGKETAGNLKARRICGGCPVSVECRELADQTGSWGMIFAGQAYSKPRYLTVTPMQSTCKHCARPILITKAYTVYCSPLCRSAANKKKRRDG